MDDRARLVSFLRGTRKTLDFDDGQGTSSPPTGPRRVLLIEDDDTDAEITTRMLRRSGLGDFEVTRFTSVAEASHHLRSGRSEIILLDLGLPDLVGEDVVPVVRRLAPATPIVVLSGDGDEHRAVQALHDGAQDYVVKGTLDSQLLARTVRLALARAESERSLRLSVVKLLVRSDELWSEIERRREVEAQLRDEQRRLSSLVAQLEASNDVRTEFLATVSHELRTPLTSIIGYSDILRDLPDITESGGANDALDVIERNSARLLDLVDDLLITAECDTRSERFERKQLDLAEVIGSVAETVQPAASKQGLTLTVTVADGLPLIWGDVSQIERATFNVVGNALKFTPPGGRVSVSVESGSTPGTVVIKTVDTGPGIAADDIEGLFERFSRGEHATTNQIQGTGLGLSIVKSIVDAHGGEVAIESEVGRGTTLSIHLPVDRRSRPDTSVEPANEQPIQSKGTNS